VELAAEELGGSPAGVVGHAGTVRSVSRPGGRVLVFVGRVHPYEGHDLDAVVHPVRAAAAAGCRTVVLTNAAGGIDPAYGVGQPVLIRDHLNLTGRSPLSGPPPPDPWPGRFVDLTDCYSAGLRAEVVAAAEPVLGGPLAQGVYAGLPGPHYETPAEIRMLATLGADLVGMSTVHEAVAARHVGLAVVGISLVTNPAAGVTGEPLDHAEVVAAGAAATGRLGVLLATTVDVCLR
jgi:purine-nucleoside phosphorylase